MKLRAHTFIFPRIMKIVGCLMILFALIIMLLVYIRKGVLDFVIPAGVVGPGLMMIFFSREKIDDERIHQLKFRSLVAGFVAAYLLTIGWHTMTSHDFVVLALTISLTAFYYLRFKL